MHNCYFVFNFKSPIIPFVLCSFRINYETMGPLTFTSMPRVEDQTIPGHVCLSMSKYSCASHGFWTHDPAMCLSAPGFRIIFKSTYLNII